MNTAVQLNELSKTFTTSSSTVEAVRNLTLTIEAGEIVALLGENGAGKTTLIDMVLGLTSPTSGSVKLMGTSPTQAVRSSQVNAVLQTGGLLKDLTVHDQVAMVAATYRQAPSVTGALRAAGIEDIARRKIGKCSGGQQQKVKFALALLGDPSILILDEPTTGMDSNARRAFWASMQALADQGKTIIFATHYLEEAQNFAQRIVMMAHGRLIADGATEDIRASSGTRTVSFTLKDAGQQLTLTEQQTRAWGLSNLTENRGAITLSCVAVEEFLGFVLPRYELAELTVTRPSLDIAFAQLAQA